jgi:hypothetical protein
MSIIAADIAGWEQTMAGHDGIWWQSLISFGTFAEIAR